MSLKKKKFSTSPALYICFILCALANFVAKFMLLLYFDTLIALCDVHGLLFPNVHISVVHNLDLLVLKLQVFFFS